jgi:hypothetical protein
MRLLASLLLSLIAVPAAAAENCDRLDGIPIIHGVQWSEVWQALAEQANCTQNCHLGSQPAGDLDLSSERLAVYFLVEQPSAQAAGLLRVEPGRPQRSLLYQKVACAEPDVGSRMPLGGHLPLELQALIHDWIAQGALGEAVEDPIPRRYIFADSLESRLPLPPPSERDEATGVPPPWRGARP